MAISNYVKELRRHVGHDLLMLPAISALIFNERGEVLLQRRSNDGRWGLIGGAIDPGEEPADALVREVFEETNLTVAPERIVGVYTLNAEYPDGDCVQYLTIAFVCRPIAGEARVNDDESLEIRYFALSELPELSPYHQLRLKDALSGRSEAFFAPPRA